MWSDFDKRGEKTFAGVIDFPSKIDADRQKKTMGIVEKLRKFLKKDKKKDVDETLFIDPKNKKAIPIVGSSPQTIAALKAAKMIAIPGTDDAK